MRLAIVDDEPLARERLRALVEELGLGEVIAEAGNGLEGVRLAIDHAPDVILLDIRMPGMDGLEAAQHLSRLPLPPAVIFTTAYDDHALAAFEAQAIDYLLKPIRAERLQAALRKAERMSGTRARQTPLPQGTAGTRTHLSALVGGALRVVPVVEVRCLQADQGYVTAYWPGGSLLVEESLRSLEEEFGTRFMRIHRNALVAVQHVTSLQRDALGNATVLLRDLDLQLPVSRRLLSQVRKRLRS